MDPRFQEYGSTETWLHHARDGLRRQAIKAGLNNRPEPVIEDPVTQSTIDEDIDPELTGTFQEQLSYEFPRPWGVQAELRRYEDFRLTTKQDWDTCKFYYFKFLNF